eukprot:10882510-Alexandrium_andersonii.AAC.1
MSVWLRVVGEGDTLSRGRALADDLLIETGLVAACSEEEVFADHVEALRKTTVFLRDIGATLSVEKSHTAGSTQWLRS